MRIGVDLRPLQNDNRYRGIGKYTESLLRALGDVADDTDTHSTENPKNPENTGSQSHSFTFYAQQHTALPAWVQTRFPDARIVGVPAKRRTRFRYLRPFLWPYTVVSPAKDSVDVLLQTDPWGGIPQDVPTVAIFHDAIPLLFPTPAPDVRLSLAQLKHVVARAASDRRYRRSLRSYRQAACVVAVSESSRRDYLRLVDPAPQAPVRVVLEALIDRSSAEPSRAALDRLDLHDRQYLLYVGGVDARKNIVQLLTDVDVLLEDHPDLKLVLVGQEFAMPANLARVGWPQFLARHPRVAEALVPAGYVEDGELQELYSHAAAFVFPSRYEGFGLPILEAMARGCPVVAYRNSAVPEVAGDAASLVDDGASMAPALADLLDDPDLRAARVQAGHEQVARFSWHDSARQLLAIFSEVARRQR